NEILFMIDTCQANTMYSKFYSPNILATGSAKLDQNSYSYENDNDIGVSVIDRYTHYILEFMEQINKTSHESMADLFASYDPAKIHSDPGVRADLFGRPLNEVRITDFFGGVAQVEVGNGGDGEARASPSGTSDGPTKGENSPAAAAVNVSQAQGKVAPPSKPAEWRITRAWGGVLLLGVLVGWVGFKR
ncbi:phosphatidylinositol glycan anchor biosynthesis, class K, isoform CRA_c, partial [Mycena metata]